MPKSSERVSQIILLHGASSSGKSTLARELQEQLPVPFWHISIDHLRDSGVLPLRRIAKGDFQWSEMRAQFFDGFHRSLAAYAGAGNNLIVEHILDTEGWFDALVDLFRPFDVLFVGVHCPLDELRRREFARGDRKMGSAESDYLTIHKNREYDLEVHSESGLAENVERVLQAWGARDAETVFKRASHQ